MPLFCSDEELVQRLAAASEDHAPGSDADLAAIRAEIDTLSSSLNATECDDPFVAEPELVLALERASSIAGDRSQQPTAVDAQVTHQAPQSKRRVLGQYQLLEELGSGGMGTVYRAVHQKLQRTVALKVLTEDRFRSADLVERFEREIRAVGMLHHPNIVAAHDAGEVNGCHFLVMELVDGIDIGQLSSRLGPLPIPEACEITRQAALGLQHISDHGLVHRDIKPSNLMLALPRNREESPAVKILDLGLALLDPNHRETARELTSTGQVMGTLDYMSPEQGLDTHSVDIRADLYSLGATLFKLLTSRAPLEDPRFNTTLKRLRALDLETPASLADLRPDCPRELAALVGRLLAKSPADRPSRPEDVALLLSRFAQGADLASLVAGVQLVDTESATAQTNTSTSASRTQIPVPASAAMATQKLADGRELPPHRHGRPRWLVAGAAALLFAAVAVILFWETPNGVVRIESNDPAIQIAFDGGELQIVGAYKEPVFLKQGQHGLRIRRGDFEFESDKLIVAKGDEIALRIELLPGRLQVIQAGKGVLDSRNIPTPAAANRETSRKPVGVVTRQSQTEQPFALFRLGKEVRSFKSMAGALAEITDDDVIEIRGPGPYAIDVEPVMNKSLSLRAAAGIRPRLTCWSPLHVRGSVALHGFDVDLRKGQLSVSGERYEISNCRVVAAGLSFTGPLFRAVDSVLLPGLGIAHDGNRGVQMDLENCLIRSQGPVVHPLNAESAKITVKNCSVYQEAFSAGGLVAATHKTSVEIAAEGNIFHHRSQAEFFSVPDWRKQLGKTLHWEGRNNLYSGALFWIADDKGQGRPAGLDDWNQLLGKPEPGSQFVPQAELTFVQLMEANSSDLRPYAEQLLTTARQRHALTELGPNFASMGPGEGYLSLLKEEHRDPIELRPEVLPGGAFVILRPGNEPVGCRTLQDAVQVAGDTDVIEIRRDGPAGAVELNSHPGRTLTLRGAPGYSPVLEQMINNGSDRLVLENLTINGRLDGTTWDAAKEAFVGSGGIHRLSHCQFTAVSGLMSRFVALDQRQPEIRNCRLTVVHYGLAEDSQLTIQDSVLACIKSGSPVASPGGVLLNRCLFWNSEPRYAFRPISTGAICLSVPPLEALTIRNSYFAAPDALLRLPLGANWESPKHWHGEANVYAVPNYVFGSGNIPTLPDWQQAVREEQDSKEDFPVIADPALWRLVPGTTGSGAGPNGRGFGADVSRVAIEQSLKANFESR